MKKRLLSFCVISLAAALLICSILPGIQETQAATIRYGSSGQTVRTIQQKLKNWGYYTGYVDGVFGSKTLSAVKYFQRTNGLTADGIIGTRTASAMGVSLNKSTYVSSSNYSDNDLYLMACCIYGEARGESYTGKVAVGAVILNRVKSSSFPNSISGVIYQNGAFTAVSDGQINMGTNNECIKAAQDALNGWDPTYGCIYYYNPKTATNGWIRSRPIITTIGKHVFCT